MGWTLEFAHINAGMLAEVGGKAANLGVLTTAGFPVPPGFCVTTAAYDAGIDKIRDEVVEAYRRLGGGPVAVRSSATAEDLPFASFAGQQDTYLNVVGEDEVVDAVQRCWASLWTDRAVAYRATNEIDDSAVKIAVVVQRMVQSEVAGVMFTANPVTGRRHEHVIDASHGLGEAVVSGAVNPDHFVVRDREITERHLGDKRFAIRSLPGGGTERVDQSTSDPALTDAQILALADLGERVERHYGSPQDTEWAIDADGTLWLTQARPITTLYPLPEKETTDPRIYFSFNVAQGVLRPFTPAGLSGAQLFASAISGRIVGHRVPDPLTGPPMLVVAGQRLFVDATVMVRSSVGRTFIPKVLGVMETRSATVLKGLFDDPRFTLKYRSRRKFLRRLLRVAWTFRIPANVAKALLNPAAAARNAHQAADDLPRLAEPATPEQRVAYIRHLLYEDVAPLLPRVFPSALAGFAMYGLAQRLTKVDVTEALRGLPHNITTQMDLELWKVAQRGEDLSEFLDRWGDRAVAEIDLGMPRWRDDPTHIRGMIANYQRLDNPDLAPDTQFARGAAAAEAVLAKVNPLARWALGRARQLIGIREMPKFLIVTAFGLVRRQLTEIGAALAEAGRISDVDDVFFLYFTELLGDTDMRAVVADRRAAYDLEVRRRRIPRVMLSDGTDVEALSTGTPSSDGIAGTPASAGTVTGIARVVLEPVGAHLEPGEILVAPSTDPGWTPLFLTAGGLVMEMGGSNSHGAVVAREYGIPAVVGVPDATQRINTGDRITVDGAAGTVTMEE
jgi:phosphohistidine swiveling domain-containing protein